MRNRHAVAVLALTLGFSACATQVHPGAPTHDMSLITQADLQSNNFRDAYDAVVALHANWLNERGQDSMLYPSQVIVYLDEMKLGGVDALHSIAASSIGFLRHYDGLEATSRWGLNHGAGVIYVSTRATH